VGRATDRAGVCRGWVWYAYTLDAFFFFPICLIRDSEEERGKSWGGEGQEIHRMGGGGDALEFEAGDLSRMELGGWVGGGGGESWGCA